MPQNPIAPTPVAAGRLRGFDMEGRRAIVFGADTPAGAAIAEAFREAGAKVGTTDPKGDHGAAVDLARESEVQEATVEFCETFGGLDVAVVAADQYYAAPIGDTLDEDLMEVLAGNLVATYNVFRSAAEAMDGSTETGRLIAVISGVALRGLPQLSAYGAAQAGIVGLVRGLSQELGTRGVTANAIATGWLDTTPGRGPDAVDENVLLRYIPMRRFGRADEVAPLAVYLASDASGYVSGQILAVDGGVLKHL